jgi:hypothetical protein
MATTGAPKTRPIARSKAFAKAAEGQDLGLRFTRLRYSAFKRDQYKLEFKVAPGAGLLISLQLKLYVVGRF